MRNVRARGLGVLALSLMSISALAAAPHRIHYSVTLAPGGSKSFPLPVSDAPVHLAASLIANNGGTQTPSALIAADIAADKSSRQLTWIAVNGDASTQAGNTLNGAAVASFAFGNAVLTATAATGNGHGTLTMTQSASTTSVPCIYPVNLTC